MAVSGGYISRHETPEKVAIFRELSCANSRSFHYWPRLKPKEVVLARKRRESRAKPEQPETVYDRARNELFSAIRQCGVIGAPEDEQAEWMTETVDFLAARYPQLTDAEKEQLKQIGLRFCQPVIPHGAQHTATSLEDANAA
jgi:hypothetical protein